MPVLAYWAIRGLAQPIRLLLNYVGEEFEDKQYEVGPAPDYNRDCWMNEKHSLGLPFPNLPYYIDGDIKIVQSNAILRYIGRKHNLCGTTEQEKVNCDVMENQIMDVRNGLVRLSYSSNFEKLKPDYVKDLPSKLKGLSEFLGKKTWFAGENITFPDFHVYEMLDVHKQLVPGCLDEFQNLKDFCDRFEALEPIAKYMKSNKFMKSPINNKMAKFGQE